MATRKNKNKNKNGASTAGSDAVDSEAGDHEQSEHEQSEQEPGASNGSTTTEFKGDRSGDVQSSDSIPAESDAVDDAHPHEDPNQDPRQDPQRDGEFKQAFEKGVNAADFNLSKEALQNFSEEELRARLLVLYPPGRQRDLIANVFLRSNKDEMMGLFGTHCAIFGMGIAVGERKALSDMAEKAKKT